MGQRVRTKDSSQATLVLCVHGTAAADPADEGRRWWQLGSEFANTLESRLPTVTFDKPHHWSGENWESDRRAAGADLLGRLRTLEVAERPYHLIGHSHGGSVIFHALRDAAANGEELKYLRSWTTVGTPFLGFVPSRISIPLVLATSLVFAASAMVLSEVSGYLKGNTGDISIELSWILFVIPLFLLLAFSLGLAYFCVRPIFEWFRSRRDDELTAKAERAFGDRWLALWHPNDEPIGGLASTLGKAPNLTPRYFWLLARALDELVWLRITRKIQGANLFGRELGRVGRSPFKTSWNAIPQTISDRMTKRCDAVSATTVSGMRPLLGTAYLSQDANSFVAELKARMTWAELLHNSYFNDSELVELIALKISPPASRTTRDTAPTLVAWLAVGPTDNVASGPPSRSRLIALSVAASLVATAFALLLAIAALSSFRAFVAPYTDRAQIDSVVTAVQNGEILNIHGNDAAGAVLSGLYKVGRLTNPTDLLAKIRERNAFAMASRSLARSYAAKDDVPRFHALATFVEGRSELLSREALLLDFIQAAPLGSKSTGPFLLEALSLIEKRKSTRERNDSYVLLASILAIRHQDQQAATAASRLSINTRDDLPCYNVANYVNVLVAVDQVDQAQRVLEMCEPNHSARQDVWLKVARTLTSLGIRSASQKATAFIAPDGKRLPDDRLSLARTHVLNGDVALAIAEIDRFLKADGMLPPEQLFDAGRILIEANKQDEARKVFQTAAVYGDYRARLFGRDLSSSSIRDYGLVIRALVAAGYDAEAKRLAGALVAALKDEQFDDVIKIENTLSFAAALPQVGLGDDRDKLVTGLEKVIDSIPDDQKLRAWLRLSKEQSESNKPAAKNALEKAVAAAGLANEYQTRSKSYSEISQLFSQLGYLRLARSTADRATVPEELLKGYAAVLGSLPKPTDYDDDWFLSVDKERTRKVMEQARKDDILANLGFGSSLASESVFKAGFAERICALPAVGLDWQRDTPKTESSDQQ